MGRRVEKFDISGKRYEFALLGTSEGARVLPKIIGMASSLESPKALGEVLATLDVNALAAPFAAATWCLGEGTRVQLSVVWEEHFAGDYEGLVLWLTEAIKYNYGPFFASLPNVMRKMKGGAE